ncbi:hypothetical protein HZA98_00445 [Candidatus Woesearchaeota archaeon]|nr:hypothetical protein [Candidatus Woesearchaeota archaeon]
MKKETGKERMEYTKETIKKIIISKLVKWNKWGATHTENILGGIPRSARGSKITREALKELIKTEWLLPALKTKEIHYSLNPEKAKEILQFYEQECKKED